MAERTHRSWAERLTIISLVVAALVSFGAAGGLAGARWALSQGQLLALDLPAPDVGVDGGPGILVPGATVEGEVADDPTPLVLAEPDAANFLITGVDNGVCADGGDDVIEDRSEIGSRTDTIMIWRANPQTNQLAILSLPRDLYVETSSGRKSRINATYRENDPTFLIDTISRNFGIPIDHYIQVDICAFQQLVDAVGGVSVPFEYPTYDEKAHLAIDEPGCVNLDGETALAYVRARHFVQLIDGKRVSDPTSDFGRIARQQDFLRRVIRKVIREGLYKPSVASALISANRDNVVRDTGLTLRRMLEFSNTLRNLDPETIASYRVESRSATLSNGDQIEYPVTSGSNMQAILAVFRGEAALADAPDQVAETTTTLAGIASSETTPNASPASTTSPGDEPTTTASATTTFVTTTVATTIPVVDAESNVTGVVPSDMSGCD